MLIILQARLEQDVNCELPDCSSWFQKRQRNQRSNCQHLLDHQKIKCSRKKIYFSFIDYAKAFDWVGHNKLWKILKAMGITVHLTCLLRNLYASQEARVRTGPRTTDWFQIEKGVRQGCILLPYLFMCGVYHKKRWVGGSTSWNQDCQEQYQ